MDSNGPLPLKAAMFFLPCIPKAQKQTRWSRTGTFPHAYDPSAKDSNNLKTLLLSYHYDFPLSYGPIHLSLTFHLPIPKTTSKKRATLMQSEKIPHTKKPDLDNLAYLVTNALKGFLFHDDSQICKLNLKKKYSELPGIWIEIEELENAF